MVKFPLYEQDRIHVEEGLTRANRLLWNLSVIPPGHTGEPWYLLAGDQALFITDNRETLEAFLYGMGLSYYVLPEPIFDQLVTDVLRDGNLEDEIDYDPPRPFAYPF